MPSNEELKEQARAKARSILSKSLSFRNMERGEQLQVYKDLVDEQYQNLTQSDLSEQHGLATGFAAADLIKERRNDRIERVGSTLGNGIKDIDFPGFVRDLLTGVFDANLDANERQMEAYQKLLKEASREVSSFVKEIDDESAMYRLVENDSQLRWSDGDDFASGFAEDDSSQKLPTITNLDGDEISSDELKAKILDTKLAMARERRTLLRETLLMGISRLVVEKGTIKASVDFKIRAAEKTTTTQQADENIQGIKKTRAGFKVGGFMGFGPSTSYSRGTTRRTSQISIATSNSDTSTEAAASIKGSVEIQFKSDYFKLDNFTQIFDLGKGQVPQGKAIPPQQPPAGQ